jgi:hypothetical protein
MAYVRVLIGRWKEEEKSLLGMLDSPPKVVCRLKLFCAGLWKYRVYLDIWTVWGIAMGGFGENGWVGAAARI